MLVIVIDFAVDVFVEVERAFLPFPTATGLPVDVSSVIFFFRGPVVDRDNTSVREVVDASLLGFVESPVR